VQLSSVTGVDVRADILVIALVLRGLAPLVDLLADPALDDASASLEALVLVAADPGWVAAMLALLARVDLVRLCDDDV